MRAKKTHTFKCFLWGGVGRGGEKGVLPFDLFKLSPWAYILGKLLKREQEKQPSVVSAEGNKQGSKGLL